MAVALLEEEACDNYRMEVVIVETSHNITEASHINPKVEEALMGVEDSNSFVVVNEYRRFMELNLEEE